MMDYWTTGYVTLYGQVPSNIVIVKEPNSNRFRFTNKFNIGVPVTFIGAELL